MADLFKLFGTVEVDTSKSNKALDETSEKGAQTQSKLSRAFSAVGRGAAVAGKAIATGLAVGGAAMAGLTMKALSLSGELEQNMGGSEAVFGEYAGKMQDTAKNAFENMGLSTSNYLATANKMGALFQGAGFSIKDSMTLSSDAMQRAADVASIMGIDTEAAMEAIAGAAKGNFTMMDNLGVAMNDTTLNAYALEKGINKTTQEMTNQEKIGLAMEMFMDKTAYAAGNYAKENETLAGSLGTAKAALTNFLDGSGDVESLVSSFGNLANVATKSLQEILPRLTTGLTGIVNQIIPMLPPLLNQLLPAIIEGATSLINGLVSAFPAIIDALMGALPALIQGVVKIVDALINALPQIIESLVSALPTLIPMVVDGLVAMIVALCTMLPEIIQPIIEHLPEIIISIVTALLENIPILIEGAISLVLGLVAAIPQIIQALVDALPDIIATVVSTLIGCLPQLIEGAIQLVIGIVKALPEILISLAKALPEALKGIWEGCKQAFSDVGGWFKRKFQEGKEKATEAWDNAKVLFGHVWGKVKEAFPETAAWFEGKFSEAKEKAVNAWSNAKDKFTEVKTKVTSAFADIKEKLSAPFTKARDTIKGIADKIKGFFKGEISMPKIKMPHFTVSPSGWKIGDLMKGKIPKLGIEWYAKAMENPILMTKPTIWGYNPETGNLQGGGEAGTEVVSGANTLMNMIQTAVAQQNNALVYYMQQLIDMLADYFPEALEAMRTPATFDPDRAAVALAVPMNRELGRITLQKGRGR